MKPGIIFFFLATSAFAACTGTSDSADSSGAAIVQGGGSDGDAAVKELRSVAAFSALTKPQQDALTRLVSQPTNILSRGARAELDTMVKDGAPVPAAADLLALVKRPWDTTKCKADAVPPCPGVLPPFAQLVAAVVRSNGSVDLGDARPTTRVGAPPPRDLKRFEQKYVALVGPAPHDPQDLIGPDDFDLTPENAAAFTLRVDGSEFTITAPLVAGALPAKDAAFDLPGDDGTNGKGLSNQSVAAVAAQVAQMPVANRELMTEVAILGRRNATDPVSADLTGRPDFRASMAANVTPVGVFGVFPFTADSPRAPETMVDTMVHESGHIWTYKQFGFDPSGKGWTSWRAAMAADVLFVSTYATTTMLEDSAESVLLYCAVRSMGQAGAALAAEMKALFPARWKILDEQFPKAN